MILVADIGNTNITCGIYQEKNIVKTFRISSDKTKKVENFVEEIKLNTKDFKITKCIIGSVVDELNELVKNSCDNIFGIDSFVFSPLLKTGVKLDVERPETVGADRIANAYGAYKKYLKTCIVVDSGSATTFDIVSSDGTFFGGIIMPGIEMQLNSLCEKTSKLQKYELEEIDSVIGRDTKTCILSGVIRGHACAIEGLINQCEKEMSEKPIIIATGGLSSLIAKYMTRKFDYLEPNLTLDGFRLLYELNNR